MDQTTYELMTAWGVPLILVYIIQRLWGTK
jgi:hypothetical protein